ncbi:hypothetical protein B296_00042135 [Ensete ventricosum]|uniref:Uncharacterized protein n=1 Tax=Ensete ventricosum TaxID=4639 RepID=A0A426ZJF6_ENSVE|nr:hypothetical protein B296_00042135 [Ensete ventricosum]
MTGGRLGTLIRRGKALTLISQLKNSSPRVPYGGFSSPALPPPARFGGSGSHREGFLSRFASFYGFKSMRKTTRYRTVPLKIDRRWSISTVGHPIGEEIDCWRSIERVSGRLRKKKGRIRGNEEKKKRRRKNTSPAPPRPCSSAVAARGSPARGERLR